MKINKDKLIEVLSVQSESRKQWRMFAYIIRQLKAMNVKYYTFNGCIYATKGEATSYPCMVAHMDTVHDICKDLTVLDIDGELTGFNKFKMRQTGIGGDDKVGIFIALQCLEKFDFLKVAFFRDEEIGCEGSYMPDNSFFWDVGFVLQCDRQGYGDFISDIGSTKLADKRFKKAVAPIIKSYGYRFYNGGMTDVMALKESGVTCAMANMACGYYNPHTDYEYVNVNDVSLCMSMVFEIIEKFKYDSFTCVYQKPAPIVYKDVKRVSSTKTQSAEQWLAEYDAYKAKRDKKDKAWDWWKNEKQRNKKAHEDWVDKTESKIRPEPDVCQSCLEEAETTYIPEWRINMCDRCVKGFITTNAFTNPEYYGDDRMDVAG